MPATDDELENEELEEEHEKQFESLSVFYGLFITMCGFACALSPVMTTNADYQKPVYFVTYIFEAYIYVTSTAWLVFMFLRILNTATSSTSFTRRQRSRLRREDDGPSTIMNTNDYGMNLTEMSAYDNDGFDQDRTVDVTYLSETQLEPNEDAALPGDAQNDDAGLGNRPSGSPSPNLSERDGPVENLEEFRRLVTIESPETVIDLSTTAKAKRPSDSKVTIRSERSRSHAYSIDSYKKSRFESSHRESGAIHLASGESVSPSFYLRIGTVAFGMGAITNVVFYIMSELEEPFYCVNADWSTSIMETVLGVVKIFFLFTQAFFIFKHSKISIVKHQLLARFAQMHLTATNICAWFDTVVQEAEHSAHIISINQCTTAKPYTTKAYNSTVTSAYDHRLRAAAATDECNTARVADPTSCASPLYDLYTGLMTYLSPLTIEYSLIAAVSSYIIYQNIGIATKISKSSISETMRKVARTRFSVDCSKSIRGLFAGIITLIVAMVVLIVVVSQQEYHVIVYYAAVDVMVLAALVACIVAFRDIRKLPQKPEEHSTEKRTTPDAILLMVSLSGVLLNIVFVLIGTLGQENVLLCVLEIIWGVLSSVQSVGQVFLISFSESRHCKTREQQKLKPGRGAILFLLMVNFALWIDHSFVSRTVVIAETAVPLFDNTSYQIIVSITLPLLIFFRFHSTACISEVWRHVYASPKKRH